MQYDPFVIMVAFILGWFCAVSSGIIFAYITFRTKKEQHEKLFPTQNKNSKGPVNIDEFATDTDAEEEDGLPPIIRQMNERMAMGLKAEELRKGK